MTETRISYATALPRIAKLCDHEAAQHRKTGHDMSAEVCAEFAAICRSLAALVEQCETEPVVELDPIGDDRPRFWKAIFRVRKLLTDFQAGFPGVGDAAAPNAEQR